MLLGGNMSQIVKKEKEKFLDEEIAKVYLTIYVPHDLKKEIRKYARKNNLSISQFIIKVLTEYFYKHPLDEEKDD